MKKFKDRLKGLTGRKIPGTVRSKIEKINQVTRGWINYYALGAMKTEMTKIDAHLRTRLRVIIWNSGKCQESANGDCRSWESEKAWQA